MVKKLKELRISAGISQQKLADVILVSQQSVNKYENHDIEPDINTLIKIADYFDVSVDYLIGRSNSESSPCQSTYKDISANEFNLIKMFRKLTKKQKELVTNIIESYIQ